MLASQRNLFSISRDVCYLNAASMSPLPLAVIEAGTLGVARKAQPWTLDPGLPAAQFDRARAAAARLLNAKPNDVALVPSVSYGIATAGKILRIGAGTRVLILEDDHASPVLEWMSQASARNFTVETVKKTGDGWTEALLEAIERPGAAPLAVASISSVHWADGGAVDLATVAVKLRAYGAAFLIDATQSAGILPLDVEMLDPDFVVFPTYKWLLGPYGRAFLYVAKRHQDGLPLEQIASGRREIESERTPYLSDINYLPDARRFDSGGRDYLISLEMAAIGMEMMCAWGAEAVAARLQMLTERLMQGLTGLSGVKVLQSKDQAPHILSLALTSGATDTHIKRLAQQNIHVSQRLGRIRVSPHVYNDEADIDRLIEALARSVSSA